MKILFILDLYKPHIGGVEVLFENLISRLSSAGNDIIILTSKYEKGLQEYEKVGKNVEIYRVGHNRYDFMLYSLFRGKKLAKNCDIIHTTTYNSAIPASIIGILTGKKVILTVHEIFGKLWYKFKGWKGFFFKFYEFLIFKFKFEKYICVSNYTKNNLRIYFGLSDKKLVTIYNGMDYEFWNKLNFKEKNYLSIKKELGLEENYIGLFYGRAGISKGLEFYLKAIKQITKEIPNFKTLLILPNSKNNPVSIVKEQVEKLKIKNNVIIISGIEREKLPNYILFSDFVIIPSLVEGFGFAVAEVSALEQNLITTNIAAIPEVASGKVNFIEPGNVDDIVVKVLDFKNGKYEKIPKKVFSWKENVDRTLEVYERVIHL